MGIEYDEDDVVGGLRKTSKAFADFYRAEREKFTGQVHWFYNPYHYYPATTFIYYDLSRADIILRRIPPLDEDALIIAHELASLVIASEGFQGVTGQTASYMAVAEMLNAMVFTPLRDSILAKYGFDVENEYSENMESAFRDVACTKPPSSPMVVHFKAWDYVTFVLYWQDVLDNQGMPTVIDDWFTSCWPQVREEGQEVLALVREIGYDTPSQATELLERIISEYALSNYLYLP